MNTTLLFVGDVGWDITLQIPHLPGPDEKVHTTGFVESAGGVIANAAVAATRAGATARGLFGFGADERGDATACALDGEGVAVVRSRRGGPSSLTVALLEPDGEKRLVLNEADSMYPGVGDVAAVDLDGIAWVHTAVYDNVSAACLVERCRAARIPWSIDLEPATFVSGLADLADHLDGAAVVFCNTLAAKRIGGEPDRVLHQMGAGAVILTRGGDGAELRPASGSAVIVRPPRSPIRVVDTTGAGDCLAGWFLAGRAAGAEPAAALTRAVAAATLSCACLGAQRSYPTREAVQAFLSPAMPATTVYQHDKEQR